MCSLAGVKLLVYLAISLILKSSMYPLKFHVVEYLPIVKSAARLGIESPEIVLATLLPFNQSLNVPLSLVKAI